MVHVQCFGGDVMSIENGFGMEFLLGFVENYQSGRFHRG